MYLSIINLEIKLYPYLDDSKVSTILLEYAITKFYEIRESLGVSYLVLYPDGGSGVVTKIHTQKLNNSELK